MRRFWSSAAAAALVAFGLAAVPAVPAQAATTTAKNLLSKITAASEAGSSTYARSKFNHWVDANGDCQDARAEVLIAESLSRVTFTSSSRCSVARGQWRSWYDGATWTLASDVDIDHMVPLKEAWESGARRWNADTRKRYANDLTFAGSLVAVTDNVNQSKGDRDPAQWLPSKNRCKYAITWVQVKYRWKLTMNGAERTALSRILSGSCGAKTVTIPPRATIVLGSTTSGGGGTGGGGGGGGLDPRYSTCTAAKEAGYGPYYRGIDDEYYWYDDRDNDGIVCE